MTEEVSQVGAYIEYEEEVLTITQVGAYIEYGEEEEEDIFGPKIQII